MRIRQGIIGVSAGVLGVVVLGGCSVDTYTAISKEQLQQRVSDALTKETGMKPDKIECPGELRIERGRTTRCVLTDGGTRLGVTVRITSDADENNNFRFTAKVDQQPMK